MDTNLAEQETEGLEVMVASIRKRRSNRPCHLHHRRSIAARGSTGMTVPTLRHDHEHGDQMRIENEELNVRVKVGLAETPADCQAAPSTKARMLEGRKLWKVCFEHNARPTSELDTF
jgi:hypothetical protein